MQSTSQSVHIYIILKYGYLQAQLFVYRYSPVTTLATVLGKTKEDFTFYHQSKLSEFEWEGIRFFNIYKWV